MHSMLGRSERIGRTGRQFYLKVPWVIMGVEMGSILVGNLYIYLRLGKDDGVRKLSVASPVATRLEPRVDIGNQSFFPVPIPARLNGYFLKRIKPCWKVP